MTAKTKVSTQELKQINENFFRRVDLAKAAIDKIGGIDQRNYIRWSVTDFELQSRVMLLISGHLQLPIRIGLEPGDSVCNVSAPHKPQRTVLNRFKNITKT